VGSWQRQSLFDNSYRIVRIGRPDLSRSASRFPCNSKLRLSLPVFVWVIGPISFPPRELESRLLAEFHFMAYQDNCSFRINQPTSLMITTRMASSLVRMELSARKISGLKRLVLPLQTGKVGKTGNRCPRKDFSFREVHCLQGGM
jgi:hypothetical protein